MQPIPKRDARGHKVLLVQLAGMHANIRADFAHREDSMSRRCVWVASGLMILIGLATCRPAIAGQTYWAGHLKVAEFDFAENTKEGQGPDAGGQLESADLTTYIFEVFQDPRGVVRHQFTSMSRNRGLDAGLDVQLFDYSAGYMVSFNKGAKAAYKSPMPIPGGVVTHLPGQRILGHQSRGVETRWNDLNHHMMIIKTWTPVDCSFRDPLFKMTTISDQSGRLEKITVEVITDLKEVNHLEESLFHLPPGLDLKTFP
jgi:hypothetical protein